MVIPVLSILLAGVFVLLLLTFHAYRSQRAAIRRIHHFIANMAQGDYGRRMDPSAENASELAAAANTLSEDLEARRDQAQEDKDHLISILALFDHTNEIALATDNMDVVRLANAAAARMFGRNAEDLLGQPIDAVIHHPDLRQLYRKAFSSNNPVSEQVAIQMPGRTVHCQATAAAIYHVAHFRGTLLMLRDVTEIARTLQMKTDFATNASHELRTPLASIRAAVDTLKELADGNAGDGGSESAEADAAMTRKCLDIISNHVLRMQLMVQDLLDLSRAEDARALIRSDRIDVQFVCEALVAASAGQLTGKKLAVRVELAADAHWLRGDERLLMLILKNLLDNAIKFTQTGSVTIRAYLSGEREAIASGNGPAAGGAEGAAMAGSHYILEVQDTGIGIPPEDQERVFERFYTVNRSRGGSDRGTGLGLSIVKHAVNAMHGSVSLISTPNVGTTLRCTFPLGEKTERIKGAATAPESAA